MSNQARTIKQSLSFMIVLAGLASPMSHLNAQQIIVDTAETESKSQAQLAELNQAELDQILAPIALYPDTLLSHILVASTYPIEVIQAARWRLNNKDLSAELALAASEDKDWDPSVKALVPFNELLQKFSDDLDWLQALGDAFLANEPQVLASVQALRQKAYLAGNLNKNDYIDVEKNEQEIIIQTIDRDIVYVPYYDTRVVYGNWWWDDYPPYYWHRPAYYVFNSGFYWSPRYYISSAFYFGGFRWNERYVYVDYNYRNRALKHYPIDSGRQVVRVKEYSRWQHDESHRRGVHYSVNGRTVSRNYNELRSNPNRYVNEGSDKKRQQIDKQRILDMNQYQHQKSAHQVDANDVQGRLKQSQTEQFDNKKQRIIEQSAGQQRERVYDALPKTADKQKTFHNEKQDYAAGNEKPARYAQQTQGSRNETNNQSRQNTQNIKPKYSNQNHSNNNRNSEKPRESKQTRNDKRSKE